MVLAMMKRVTWMGLYCPRRWILSCACCSTAGFHLHRSGRPQLLARVRVSPRAELHGIQSPQTTPPLSERAQGIRGITGGLASYVLRDCLCIQVEFKKGKGGRRDLCLPGVHEHDMGGSSEVEGDAAGLEGHEEDGDARVAAEGADHAVARLHAHAALQPHAPNPHLRPRHAALGGGGGWWGLCSPHTCILFICEAGYEHRDAQEGLQHAC